MNNVRHYFEQHTGIVLSDQQLETVTRFLEEEIKKYQLNSIHEYLDKVQHDPQYAQSYDTLLEKITINESYFFREQVQIDFLEQFFLPRLIQKRRECGNLTLRIWSAGCSLGQEIYTLNIILHRLLDDFDQWNIYLLGTDINPKCIEEAQLGLYSHWSIRNVPDDILAKYFNIIGRQYQIHQKIIEQTTFLEHNLTQNDYPSFLNGTGRMDLILCRNVLIYFDNKRAHDILTRFSHCLSQEGILLLGVADALQTKKSNLSKHSHGKVQYFTPTIKSAPLTQPKKVVEKPSSPRLDKPTVIKKHTHPVEAVTDPLALANQGRLDEAFSLCESEIARDPTNEKPMLIQALIYMEQKNLSDAEKRLKQAIFLNSNCIDAHYSLALLYLRLQKKEQGIKQMKITLRKLESSNPDNTMIISPEITYSQLTDTIRNQLNMHPDVKKH